MVQQIHRLSLFGIDGSGKTFFSKHIAHEAALKLSFPVVRFDKGYYHVSTDGTETQAFPIFDQRFTRLLALCEERGKDASKLYRLHHLFTAKILPAKLTRCYGEMIHVCARHPTLDPAIMESVFGSPEQRALPLRTRLKQTAEKLGIAPRECAILLKIRPQRALAIIQETREKISPHENLQSLSALAKEYEEAIGYLQELASEGASLGAAQVPENLSFDEWASASITVKRMGMNFLKRSIDASAPDSALAV